MGYIIWLPIVLAVGRVVWALMQLGMIVDDPCPF